VDLTTLASGLLWVWFALAPASAPGFADQLIDDLMQLRQPQSARFQITGQIGSGGISFPLRGSGAFAQPDRFQMALDLSGSQLEQIIVGDTLYQRTSNDPVWRTQRVGQGTVPGPPGIAPVPSTLPPDAQEALGEFLNSFKLVGTEAIGDAQTRHYRGELDLLALSETFGGDPGSLRNYEKFSIGIELWIGIDDHFIHQLTLGMDVRDRTATAGRPGDLQATLTMTFSSFDEPVQIAAPIGQPTPPTPTPTPRPAPVQAPAQVPSGRQGRAQQVRVTASDIRFDLKEIRVQTGRSLEITLENSGVLEHNFSIDQPPFKLIAPAGQTVSGAVITPGAGSYDFYCSVPGHRGAGMAGKLIVSDSG
jgi:plastocyanin